ncbi:small nuclear ribonucleoprotein [Phakopsora pachyrhizi]|uniref:U6 snRNA-associated Sm-like protein LSm6 n=1 Tax=Phakopsora pachyrhizi TaxID=170000 RepID=A0AAV0B2X5_PHAPC|nr:small nuclear ribonucleoprotein [Phakopsora pachyrhizi]CAH7676819.1 small nuclear ribonucleo protein [Phakopsora pachyrhizi]
MTVQVLPSEEISGDSNGVGTGGTPSDFLKQVVGHQVVVRLNSGVDYKGVLSCLDGYMNIALENTEEYVNGIKRNSYGDAFLRGNNVLYISRAE